MAFESKKKEIQKALHAETKDPEIEVTAISIPVFNEAEVEEKTKTYTFTLQPSVRKKLDIVAKEHNYKSASKFINELIKKMD